MHKQLSIRMCLGFASSINPVEEITQWVFFGEQKALLLPFVKLWEEAVVSWQTRECYAKCFAENKIWLTLYSEAIIMKVILLFRKVYLGCFQWFSHTGETLCIPSFPSSISLSRLLSFSFLSWLLGGMMQSSISLVALQAVCLAPPGGQSY